MNSRRGLKLFFLALLFLCSKAFSYDNLIIHPELSEASVNIYNSQKEDKINLEQKKWIVEGSVAEDTDPRYRNHFYDPQKNSGLDDYDNLFKVKTHFTGISAKEWAKVQDSVSGDYSEGAILKNYKEGNLKRAYQGVGHILHLIQDMSVPAHTRNDAHPAGDPFEEWAKKYGKINNKKINFISIDNLDQVFDDLSFYSHDNFFSKDSIKNIDFKDYQIIKDNYLGVENEYLLNNIDKINYKLILVDRTGLIPVYEIDDFKVHLDYWNMLYPKAVGYSAGVIDYFKKEFKKIDEEKKDEISLLNKIKNSLGKIKGSVNYGFGDLLLASREIINNTSQNFYSGTQKGIEEMQFFVEANKEIVENTIKKSEDIVKNTAENLKGKVLSVSEKNAKEEKEPEKEKNEDNKNLAEEKDNEENYKIKRVIDGDTFVLESGEIIRYIGMDTPELNSSGGEDDECLAWVAKIRNIDLLGRGKLEIVKDPSVDKDKYGRSLRYVYSGGIFINNQLVLDGLAEPFFCLAGWENCPVTSDEKRKEEILLSYEDAKNNKRGLFSGVCEEENNIAQKEKEIKIVFPDKKASSTLSIKTEKEKMNIFLFTQGELKENEDERGVENEEELFPELSLFKLYDLISQSEIETASSTVGVKIELNSNDFEIQYFLSNASTTPDIDNFLWLSSSPNEWQLEENNGEKEVFLWLKYENDIICATSSSINLNQKIIPQVVYLNINSLTSSSTTYTASTTVTFDYEIENLDFIDYYFLSQASTTPEISSVDWFSFFPENFIFSEGDGEKEIYIWFKYEEKLIGTHATSSIILDTLSPSFPTIDNITKNNDVYWVNKNEINLSGNKEKLVNNIIINNENNVSSSSEENWNVNYNFDFQCVYDNLGELMSCFSNYCSEHDGVCDNLNNENDIANLIHSFHEKEIILKAKDEAGNLSSENSNIFKLDIVSPQISVFIQRKSIPSKNIYLYAPTGENSSANPFFFHSGIKEYELEYKINGLEDWEDAEVFESNHSFFSFKTVIEEGGEYLIRSRAVDFAGNIGDWSKEIEVKVDFYPVISEVYINEENAGSEWIELYNPTENDINIGGWEIDTKSDDIDVIIPENAIIASHGFYLIGDMSSDIWNPDDILWPLPDHIETMALANSDGWIILRKKERGDIVDTVGWGSAESYENRTVSIVNYNKGESVERLNLAQAFSNNYNIYQEHGNGCDSDRNDSDFFVNETPNPQNSSSEKEEPLY